MILSKKMRQGQARHMCFTKKCASQAHIAKPSKSHTDYRVMIMIASLLSFLFSACTDKSKHTPAEIEQEKQTILSHLSKSYPADSFTIQAYRNTSLGGANWISKRNDYKFASYSVFSKQLNQPFYVNFRWDDTWSNVTVTENEYPYRLLSRAQQQRIEELGLPYPIKAIIRVMSKKEEPAWLSQVNTVNEALDFLNKSEDFDIYSIILVTVPNATDEATLIELTEKIKSYLIHINHQDDSKKVIQGNIYFYSDDQIDLSEVTLDLSKHKSVGEIVEDLETYYKIDSPYYQVSLKKDRKEKGSRFGM